MSSGRHLAAVVESDYSDIADIDGAKASYYVISWCGWDGNIARTLSQSLGVALW